MKLENGLNFTAGRKKKKQDLKVVTKLYKFFKYELKSLK